MASTQVCNMILDMVTHKVINLAAPTNPNDAARLADITAFTVSGLTQDQILYGNSAGNIGQSANFTFDATNKRLTLTSNLSLPVRLNNPTISTSTGFEFQVNSVVVGALFGANGQTAISCSSSSGFVNLYAGGATNPAFAVSAVGDVYVGRGTALAPASTVGYFWTTTSTGPPTGVPAGDTTFHGTDMVAQAFDTANKRIYYYTGGVWHFVALNDGVVSGYQFIRLNGGSPLTQRDTINFSSRFNPTDNSGSSRTDVDLATSGVTATSYTNANITVDTFGRVTLASNGTGAYTGTVAGAIPFTAPTTFFLTEDDTRFRYETGTFGGTGTHSRFYVGAAPSLTNNTNVGSAMLLAGPDQALTSIIRIQGGTAQLQGWEGVPGGTERPIAVLKFQDGNNGPTSGSLLIQVRQSDAGGGALIDAGQFTGCGLLLQNGPLYVGASGIDQDQAGKAYIALQERGTPPVSFGGLAFIRYRTSGSGGSNRAELSNNAGAYSPIATLADLTGFASPSLTNRSIVISAGGATLTEDNSNAVYDTTNHRMVLGNGGTYTAAAGARLTIVTSAGSSRSLYVMADITQFDGRTGININPDTPGANAGTVAFAVAASSTVDKVYLGVGGVTIANDSVPRDYIEVSPGSTPVVNNTVMTNVSTMRIRQQNYHNNNNLSWNQLATLLIDGPPQSHGVDQTAGTSAYSIMVAAGDCRFVGRVDVGNFRVRDTVANGTNAVSFGSTGPTNMATSPSKWIHLRDENNDRFLIPAFAYTP